MPAAALHNLQCSLPHRFRRAVAKLSRRVYIAHYHYVLRNMGEHLSHVNGIAEVVRGIKYRVNHRNRAAAAVMVNHKECIVLHGLNYLFYIWRRELLS